METPDFTVCADCGAPATAGTGRGVFCDRCAAAQPRLCDFCYLCAPTWAYPCRSFAVVLPGALVIADMNGPWGACDTCRPLVDAGDWSAVVERALIQPRREGLEALLPVFRETLPALYALFREHRTGPAVRVAARPL